MMLTWDPSGEVGLWVYEEAWLCGAPSEEPTILSLMLWMGLLEEKGAFNGCALESPKLRLSDPPC